MTPISPEQWEAMWTDMDEEMGAPSDRMLLARQKIREEFANLNSQLPPNVGEGGDR